MLAHGEIIAHAEIREGLKPLPDREITSRGSRRIRQNCACCLSPGTRIKGVLPAECSSRVRPAKKVAEAIQRDGIFSTR